MSRENVELLIKMFGVLMAVSGVLWKLGGFQEEMRGGYNLLSWQTGELSKQVATDRMEQKASNDEIKRRTEAIERTLMGGRR